MLFERRDTEQYADSLAAYLPGGELFASKSVQNSNFRKLLRGLAGELFTANGLLIEYDILPDATVNFLSEWESVLGIPDACFSVSEDNDERRRNILIKLAVLGAQTTDDFEAIATAFGMTVSVVAGADSGISFPNNKTMRHTLVISIALPDRFTYTFPISFGNDAIVLLQCVFSKLKPANCQLLFQEV